MADTTWMLLKDLATRKSDATARRLGALFQRRQQAQRQLQMLLDYRRDYEQRLAHTAGGGIDAQKMRNYQVFLANLERALEHQTDALATIQEEIYGVQKEWNGHRRKADSFQVLADRDTRSADRKAQQRDQKLTDEFAARRHAVAATPGGAR
jgi:flagellar FliJ protein